MKKLMPIFIVFSLLLSCRSVFAGNPDSAVSITPESLTEEAQVRTPDAGLIGQTLSFETTDMDGNPVTSEELFRNNRITMIHLWGTCCDSCADEIEDLVKVHARLQEKGCGIVGIEQEKDPIDTIADQIHTFIEENGMNYPSVLMPDHNAVFTQITGFPATFFVDSAGKILTDPLLEAHADEYERIADQLLDSGKTDTESGAEAVPDKRNEYRVIVSDRDGHPVEGAMIQFCDDLMCSFQPTGADGVSVFSVEEQKAYEVHILQAPEGFLPDETIYTTAETYSDVQIILDKAE